MNHKEKPKKPQGDPCIFCGQRPTSREHFLPWWTRKFFPDPIKSGYGFRVTNPFDTNFVKEVKNFQGYIRNNKLKIVCEKCNNSWMSKIENDAISILTPLMNGDAISLNQEQQQIIARWSVLRSIIAEYVDRRRLGIQMEARKFFMENKTPPAHWKIWIGKWNPELGSPYYGHHAFGSADLKHPNMQLSTFLLNHLIIHTFCSEKGDFDYILKEYLPTLMRQIHPFENEIEDWGEMPVFDEKSLFDLKHNLFIKKY